ncbi:hypothetical protein DFH06DRAFT_1479424 [Mycena polygramma]|nr:hypothetical protein DFH06DRAFT_1479424 [Mycena polygramma]
MLDRPMHVLLPCCAWNVLRVGSPPTPCIAAPLAAVPLGPFAHCRRASTDDARVPHRWLFVHTPALLLHLDGASAATFFARNLRRTPLGASFRKLCRTDLRRPLRSASLSLNVARKRKRNTRRAVATNLSGGCLLSGMSQSTHGVRSAAHAIQERQCPARRGRVPNMRKYFSCLPSWSTRGRRWSDAAWLAFGLLDDRLSLLGLGGFWYTSRWSLRFCSARGVVLVAPRVVEIGMPNLRNWHKPPTREAMLLSKRLRGSTQMQPPSWRDATGVFHQCRSDYPSTPPAFARRIRLRFALHLDQPLQLHLAQLLRSPPELYVASPPSCASCTSTGECFGFGFYSPASPALLYRYASDPMLRIFPAVSGGWRHSATISVLSSFHTPGFVIRFIEPMCWSIFNHFLETRLSSLEKIVLSEQQIHSIEDCVKKDSFRRYEDLFAYSKPNPLKRVMETLDDADEAEMEALKKRVRQRRVGE